MTAPASRLTYRARLVEYEQQAEQLLAAWKAGDKAATKFFGQHHPRFRDDIVKWLPRNTSDAEIRGATMDDADAKLAIARWHEFSGWPELSEYVDAVGRDGSSVHRFEAAVEAV